MQLAVEVVGYLNTVGGKSLWQNVTCLLRIRRSLHEPSYADMAEVYLCDNPRLSTCDALHDGGCIFDRARLRCQDCIGSSLVSREICRF